MEEAPSQTHQTALLLPWYAEGTLSQEEHRRVEAHLRECQTCRQELADIRKIQQRVSTFYAEQPRPSPDVFARVKARIHQLESRQQQAQTVTSPKWWETWLSVFESWTRPLFVPQWAPTLAVALIVAQASLLVLTSVSRDTQPEDVPGIFHGPVIERSIPPATVPELKTTIKVELTFNEETPENQFREVIQELGGRLIDGPTKEGSYLIAIEATDPEEVDQKIKTVLAKSHIVRAAERLNE